MKDKNLGSPINQEEIYHYLKDIRKIKVMTPDREKELAKKISPVISPDFITKIESGKYPYDNKTYNKILNVLNIKNINKNK